MEGDDEHWKRNIVILSDDGKSENIQKTCDSLRRFLAYDVSPNDSRNSTSTRLELYSTFDQCISRIYANRNGWMHAAILSCDTLKNDTSSTSTFSFGSAHATMKPPAMSELAKSLMSLLSPLGESEGSLFLLVLETSHGVEFKYSTALLPLPTQVALSTNMTHDIPWLYTHGLKRNYEKQQKMTSGRNTSILVSMAEYFLLYFVQFPVSKTRAILPKSRTRRTWSIFRSEGHLAIIAAHPYLTILLHYLRYFFEPAKSKSKRSLTRNVTPLVFLHMLCEAWCHQNALVVMTKDAKQHGASATADVHISGEYISPTAQVLESLLVTIVFFCNQPQKVTGLSEPLEVMQPKLYSFLKIVWVKGSISIAPQIFMGSLDLWLAWTQPWKVTEAYSKGASETSSSVFDAKWEMFVLSNYHFYTTLFGVMLTQFGEFDYQNVTESSAKVVRVLQRILNVYTPAMLRVLKIGQSLRRTPLDNVTVNVPSSRQLPTSNSMEIQTLTSHCHRLGVLVEPVDVLTFREQATALYDKLRAPTPSTRSSSTSHKDHLSRIADCRRDLQRIFDLHPDELSGRCSQIEKSTKEAAVKESLLPPERNRVTLTAKGRSQILAGERVSTRSQVGYIGDPLYQPIRNYEVGFLVTFFVAVSNTLNMMCSLDKDGREWEKKRKLNIMHREKWADLEMEMPPLPTFRFNLRFLASPFVWSILAVMWVFGNLVVWMWTVANEVDIIPKESQVVGQESSQETIVEAAQEIEAAWDNILAAAADLEAEGEQL